MKKRWSLWRWLFHRRTQPAREFSPGITAYLSTSWRRDAAFVQDFIDDPTMCAPDMGTKKTAHITRIIEATTRPLPSVVDHDAPTEEFSWHDFYADETLGIECVDQYATQPMDMAEV